MDLYLELSEYLDKLKEYKALLSELFPNPPLVSAPIRDNNPFAIFEGEKYKEKQAKQRDLDNIREYLLRKSGILIPKITELTGNAFVTIHEFGKPRSVNMWDMGLRAEIDYRTSEALNACIDNVNIAIGKLESEIKKSDVREHQVSNVAEPQASKENRGTPILKDKPFEKPIEIVLNTTPEVLSPIIKTVVSEFEPEEGLGYHSVEESESASSSFRKILIIALEVIENSIASEDCIGIITLQLLANNQILFRVPPRGHWYFTNEPKSLPNLKIEGHVSNDEFNLFYDELYFTHILERLFAEFQRLGFKESTLQKVWRRFKEIIEIWNKVKP